MRVTPIFPPGAKAILVGEASGKEEEAKGVPFIGQTGRELDRLLVQSGLVREELAITNVFLDRPPDNDIETNWCISKKEAVESYKLTRPHLVASYPKFDWPQTYIWSSLSQGKYLKPQRLVELARLKAEIEAAKPNLVVALGGKALWALYGTSGIKKLRGAVTECVLVPGVKLLPTWHPAYIMRNWGDRLHLVADLAKVKEQMEFPEIRRPERQVWISPTLDDLLAFEELYIDVEWAKLLSFDTETMRGQISCISFAPSSKRAITVPFIDKTKPDWNYWSTANEEAEAWKWVRRQLAKPMPKLAQNGLYDLQYLWRTCGIPVKNYLEDTMLLHHALYLELSKDLGFLGSIYTDEAAWKLMRPRGEDAMERKDD